MKVVHRLVGYDRRTDRLKARYDIPVECLAEAKRIALVAADDPDAAWSYPLSADQARAIAQLVCAEIDVGPLDFFLEPFANSAVNSGTTQRSQVLPKED
jgi:hypothetical protein